MKTVTPQILLLLLLVCQNGNKALAGPLGSGSHTTTSCSVSDGWLTSGDQCLLIGGGAKNWTESRVSCKDRYSDLASFPDHQHDRILLDRLSAASPFWVGYRYSQSNPGWLTGLPKVDTTRFQTVSSSGQYLCGNVVVSGNGTHRFLNWRLDDCTLPYLFICMVSIQGPTSASSTNPGLRVHGAAAHIRVPFEEPVLRHRRKGKQTTPYFSAAGVANLGNAHSKTEYSGVFRVNAGNANISQNTERSSHVSRDGAFIHERHTKGVLTQDSAQTQRKRPALVRGMARKSNRSQSFVSKSKGCLRKRRVILRRDASQTALGGPVQNRSNKGKTARQANQNDVVPRSNIPSAVIERYSGTLKRAELVRESEAHLAAKNLNVVVKTNKRRKSATLKQASVPTSVAQIPTKKENVATERNKIPPAAKRRSGRVKRAAERHRRNRSNPPHHTDHGHGSHPDKAEICCWYMVPGQPGQPRVHSSDIRCHGPSNIWTHHVCISNGTIKSFAPTTSSSTFSGAMTQSAQGQRASSSLTLPHSLKPSTTAPISQSSRAFSSTAQAGNIINKTPKESTTSSQPSQRISSVLSGSSTKRYSTAALIVTGTPKSSVFPRNGSSTSPAQLIMTSPVSKTPRSSSSASVGTSLTTTQKTMTSRRTTAKRTTSRKMTKMLTTNKMTSNRVSTKSVTSNGVTTKMLSTRTRKPTGMTTTITTTTPVASSDGLSSTVTAPSASHSLPVSSLMSSTKSLSTSVSPPIVSSNQAQTSTILTPASGGHGLASPSTQQAAMTSPLMPVFNVMTSLAEVVNFVNSVQCNVSLECLSHVLLHPDLSADVKLDLLTSDPVPWPDLENGTDHTTLASDSIGRFFRILNRYLGNAGVGRYQSIDDGLEQTLLTLEVFMDKVMARDLHKNSSMLGRFSHLEFQIEELTVNHGVEQFRYWDEQNLCNISHVHMDQSETERQYAKAVFVSVVMQVPNRNVSMETGDTEEGGIIGSPVLLFSGYVNGRPRSLKHSFRLQHNFKPAETNASFKPRCVFLEKRSRIWSTYGCEVVDANGDIENDDKENGEKEDAVTCHCNHTSNFAILMQIVPFKVSEVNRVALSIITYIGCSITLITQFMAITVFTCIGSLNCERVCVHRNLCIAIVGAQITFLAGIEAVENRLVCAVVAILLHYWYTAVFIWMLVEGLHLYLKVVRVFGTERARINYYVCFGWGMPVVLVTISAVADWGGYGTPTSCWLSTQRNTIWAFVGPALAIIIVNLVILVAVVKVVMASAKLDKHGEFDHVRAGVKAALLLLPLLGLTWLFGLAAVNEDLIVFQYLFAIFNTLQGFFIFLFHCAFNTEVRQAVRRLQEKRSLQRGDLSSLAGFSSSPSVSPTPSVQDQKKPLCRGDSPMGELSAPFAMNRVVPARYTTSTNIVNTTLPSSTTNIAHERGLGRHHNTRRKTQEMSLMFI